MALSKNMFMEERETDSSMVELFNQDYPVSKSTIEQQAIKAVDIILESGSPINAAQLLKAVESFIETVRKDKRLIDFVRDELAKSSGKVTLASGTRIEAAEVATQYDYSKCNDPILLTYGESLERFKEAVKERQDFLRTVPASGMEIVSDDEVVTVFPPVKTSTSSYKVTLAK